MQRVIATFPSSLETPPPTGPGPSNQAKWKTSVAVDGHYVVVGFPYDNTGAGSAGEVHIYQHTGEHICAIQDPTPSVNDLFGWEVELSGDHIIISEIGDDSLATDSGAVHIYDLNDLDDSDGNQFFDSCATPLMPTQTFTIADLVALNPQGARFGRSLDVDGDMLAVGAPDFVRGARGYVGVYDLASSTLVNTFVDPSSTQPAVDRPFGDSIDIDNGRLLVSNIGDDSVARNAGQAYLFDVAGGALLRTFDAPSGDQEARFGARVALDEDRVAVLELRRGINNSGYLDATYGHRAGRIHVFDANDGSLLQTLENPFPTQGDGFGESLEMEGGFVVAAAPYHSWASQEAGRVYQFKTTNPGHL